MSEENKNVPDYAGASLDKEPEKQPENIQATDPPENDAASGEDATSSEQIFLPDTEEQSLTDSNDNMEVHHHSHAGHGKKNWKSYFWEFLMLFLAVFCGFLAENQREHYIEHSREKQFMRTMVADIQTDTGAIAEKYDLGNIIKLKSDTLINLINNTVPDSNILTIYRLHVETGRVVHAQFENRTSTQLKNSGGMRLIRNTIVADSLRYYWNMIDNLENIASRLEILLIKGADLGAKLFHNKYISKREADNPLDGQLIINPAAKLITPDENLLAEYSNLKRSRETVLLVYLFRLKLIKGKATALMALIKKEYDIE